jgi:hypothetical protein
LNYQWRKVMKRASSVLRVSIAVLIALTASAQATQIIYRSPQQMGEESVLVVQGKVTGVRSFWNDAHTKIFTETQVAVDRSFKGAAGGTVSVVQLGGTVGHVRMNVEGALAWRPGEEVLLFLESFPGGGRYMVYGLSQGKYGIQRDDRGRPYVSRAALAGVEMPDAPGGGRPETERVPLNTFIDRALGVR